MDLRFLVSDQSGVVFGTVETPPPVYFSTPIRDSLTGVIDKLKSGKLIIKLLV